MRVLIVCSINCGKVAPFVSDQTESLKKKGIEIDFYTISQKGLLGYLKSRKGLLQKIREFTPDIIHAHYGLSGLFANLQRRVPVVTTYHGSDINYRKMFRFSKFAIFLSKFNIFVSQKNIEKAKPKQNYALIPCGVDTELFKPLDKAECRAKLGFTNDEKIVLFSSSFDNQIKNPTLAKNAVALLPNVRLIELKGYSRQQVSLLMNAVDVVLMTSFTEGSPQFIKEAMACNCPIVSVDVGDVKEVISGVENCFITSDDDKVIAECLHNVLSSGKRTIGRDKIKHFDNQLIVCKIVEIYNKILS